MNNKRTHILHCNYINKGGSPMGGRCNSENVVYQADFFSMEISKEKKVYIGISVKI